MNFEIIRCISGGVVIKDNHTYETLDSLTTPCWAGPAVHQNGEFRKHLDGVHSPTPTIPISITAVDAGIGGGEGGQCTPIICVGVTDLRHMVYRLVYAVLPPIFSFSAHYAAYCCSSICPSCIYSLFKVQHLGTSKPTKTKPYNSLSVVWRTSPTDKVTNCALPSTTKCKSRRPGGSTVQQYDIMHRWRINSARVPKNMQHALVVPVNTTESNRRGLSTQREANCAR